MLISICLIFLSSCSYRLLDFTVISSKNTNLTIDKTKGKRTEGKSMKFLGIGVTIKDAVDDALENAGSKYDILIDGVLRAKNFPFYGGYIVEGTAFNSDEMQAALGEEEYQKWLKENDVFDSETLELTEK